MKPSSFSSLTKPSRWGSVVARGLCGCFVKESDIPSCKTGNDTMIAAWIHQSSHVETVIVRVQSIRASCWQGRCSDAAPARNFEVYHFKTCSAYNIPVHHFQPYVGNMVSAWHIETMWYPCRAVRVLAPTRLLVHSLWRMTDILTIDKYNWDLISYTGKEWPDDIWRATMILALFYAPRRVCFHSSGTIQHKLVSNRPDIRKCLTVWRS